MVSRRATAIASALLWNANCRASWPSRVRRRRWPAEATSGTWMADRSRRSQAPEWKRSEPEELAYASARQSLCGAEAFFHRGRPMTAPVQTRAKRSGSKSTSSSASLRTGERRARQFAVNEPDDTHELGAERDAYTAGSGTLPVNGFSFSQVSVLGLQRKCACGGVAG